MKISKRVYLVERPLTTTETSGFLSVLHEHAGEVFLSYADDILEQAGARRWDGLSTDLQKAANNQLLENLDALGHLSIGKQTVASLLYYKGFQTWYYHKFRINWALQPFFQRLEGYRRLATRGEQLIVYATQAPDPVISSILKGVLFVPAAAKPIAVATKKKPILKAARKQLGQMFKRFTISAKQVVNRKITYPPHLMVLNHANLKEILDPENLPNLYQDNVFAAYFLRQWADRFLIVDKLLLDKNEVQGEQTHAYKGTYFQRNLLFNEWIEVLAVINPAILWRCWRFHCHLQKTNRKISRSLKDPLHRIIFRSFTKLHTSSLYFFFTYNAYRNFLKANNFRSVSLFDEYSPNFRAIIDAARQEGVRTQAIQHGSLASMNPGYRYSDRDNIFNPWPDRTLVWGQYWKDFFVEKAAYPPERIRITGQIRTDIIPCLQQTQLDVASILGAPAKDRFLILLATQPQPNEQIRQQVALDTFQVARDIPNAWVVLKPHPRETDPAYYIKLAAAAGCTNYSIHYEADLYLLLRLCHVLVHCYSTVGIEAVYFGLPTIIMDYLEEDMLNFAAEDVALQALQAADLRRHLLAIQAGQCQLNEEKRQAYIQKYACAVDGSVSERTAQALLGE